MNKHSLTKAAAFAAIVITSSSAQAATPYDITFAGRGWTTTNAWLPTTATPPPITP